MPRASGRFGLREKFINTSLNIQQRRLTSMKPLEVMHYRFLCCFRKRAESEARKGSLPNSKELPSHHPTDPVELRRLNFQTPGKIRTLKSSHSHLHQHLQSKSLLAFILKDLPTLQTTKQHRSVPNFCFQMCVQTSYQLICPHSTHKSVLA